MTGSVGSGSDSGAAAIQSGDQGAPGSNPLRGLAGGCQHGEPSRGVHEAGGSVLSGGVGMAVTAEVIAE